MKTQLCVKCGAKLPAGARFCSKCGARFSQPATATRTRKNPPARKYKKRRREPRRGPLLALVGGGLLIVASALLALKLNRPAPVTSSVPDSHSEEGIPYPQVPRILPVEARARYDAGTAIFVDVRTQGEFETAHIPNAISLPLADLDARYRELPREAEIITYCT